MLDEEGEQADEDESSKAEVEQQSIEQPEPSKAHMPSSIDAANIEKIKAAMNSINIKPPAWANE